MTDKPTQTSPFLPWKTRIATSFLSTFSDFARRQNGTINRRFISLFDFRAPANPEPIKGVKSSDVTVDSSRDLWFRLFVPTTTTISSDDEGNDVVRLPVMVFFHGGGFSFLRPDSKAYDLACRRFALKIPAVVVSVNYRLTPEHRYPCQYDDGFDILKFLDENRESLPENADVSKCFLAGDSAGANIAHNVAIRAAPATFGRVKVIGLIPIQPFFGGEERTEPEIRLTDAPIVSVSRSDWHWKVFLPEGSDRDHEAANVSGPRAADISSVENFPKTMVFVGGMDPLQEWQKRYYEWLKRSGKEVELKEYPSAIHAFYMFPELPESSMLFTEVKNFVKRTIIQSKY